MNLGLLLSISVGIALLMSLAGQEAIDVNFAGSLPILNEAVDSGSIEKGDTGNQQTYPEGDGTGTHQEKPQPSPDLSALEHKK